MRSLVMGILPRAPFEKVIASARAAEMVKYFGNAFYALKVAYANQMFDLCEKIGVEYDLVKECCQSRAVDGFASLGDFSQRLSWIWRKMFTLRTRERSSSLEAVSDLDLVDFKTSGRL
jgi:hypothetical protein